MNAGSRLPPLALSTALTTAPSIEGKASLRVFSACCCGLIGRGGLGGGASSSGAGGASVGGSSDGELILCGTGGASVSRGSSSNSNSFPRPVDSRDLLVFGVCQ